MIARRIRDFLSEEDWQFAEHERPALPGSPGSPLHPRHRQIAYALIGILLGLTVGFGNALISANTYTLQGALGLDPAEIAWLPTVYVMTNVSINLLMIKFRAQFGLRPFAMIFLILYVLITLAHLFVHGFATAIAVRAISGMAGAALSSLCLYYVMQSLPAKWRLKGVVLGIGIPQCATPLARLFSPDLLAMSQWRTLYLFELGLALLSLAAVAALRLPPTTRSKAFEPLDFLTFVLFAGSTALFAAVLGLGRIVWWTNAPWIGWALIAAIPMFAAALVVEHHRANPLLNTRWLGSADIVRFTIVIVMARIVLSEQTYASVGLLTVLGQNNDQARAVLPDHLRRLGGRRDRKCGDARRRATRPPDHARDRAGRSGGLVRFLRDQPDARAADVCDAGDHRFFRDVLPGPGAAVRHDPRAEGRRRPYHQLHRAVRDHQFAGRTRRHRVARQLSGDSREGEQRRAGPADLADRPDRRAAHRRGRCRGQPGDRRSDAAECRGGGDPVANHHARSKRACV
ncbi:MFS transporter [Sphingomonas aurantiaca]|uniref:MFS transporter n=1 Tax=Sphingomonas aurantiaca TaxID=185949 RepID=UPI002FE3FD03